MDVYHHLEKARENTHQVRPRGGREGGAVIVQVPTNTNGQKEQMDRSVTFVLIILIPRHLGCVKFAFEQAWLYLRTKGMRTVSRNSACIRNAQVVSDYWT